MLGPIALTEALLDRACANLQSVYRDSGLGNWPEQILPPPPPWLRPPSLPMFSYHDPLRNMLWLLAATPVAAAALPYDSMLTHVVPSLNHEAPHLAPP